MSYHIVQDMQRCIGCQSCQVQCKSSKDLPVGPKPCQVVPIGPVMHKGKPRAAHIFLSCFHCRDAACIKACPTGAMKCRPADGVVYVESELCIGCRSCILACPWGAPQWNSATEKVVKCDLCMDRLDVGLAPACVTTCTSKCLSAVRLRYDIDAAACTGCGVCATRCPVQAATGELKQLHAIDLKLCIKCGECFRRCKFLAVLQVAEHDDTGCVMHAARAAVASPSGIFATCTQCGKELADQAMEMAARSVLAQTSIPALSGHCQECTRKALAAKIAASRFIWAKEKGGKERIRAKKGASNG